MDWQQIAPDFEPDGGLRDIYVFGTDLLDWQHIWDALRTWEPLPSLVIGGQSAIMPDKVQEVLAASREQGAMLSVNVSGALANCYFWGHDEIQFDVDPREIIGPAQIEGLDRFMSLMG